MAVAPSMDAAGDATRVPAHTSDLIELVSGVCQARRHDATLAWQWAGWTAQPVSELEPHAVWCSPAAVTWLSLQMLNACVCLHVPSCGGLPACFFHMRVGLCMKEPCMLVRCIRDANISCRPMFCFCRWW